MNKIEKAFNQCRKSLKEIKVIDGQAIINKPELFKDNCICTFSNNEHGSSISGLIDWYGKPHDLFMSIESGNENERTYLDGVEQGH